MFQEALFIITIVLLHLSNKAALNVHIFGRFFENRETSRVCFKLSEHWIHVTSGILGRRKHMHVKHVEKSY